MFKRLFWVSIGVGIGVVAVTKAQAYVKANTPDTARQFLLGPDQDHVTMRTLEGLVNEFNATRRAREAELNSKYAARNMSLPCQIPGARSTGPSASRLYYLSWRYTKLYHSL